MLEPSQRRQAIIKILQQSAQPVTGGQLADRFGVTRAVIVQDVAVLRAGDQPITATPHGYQYEAQPRKDAALTTQIAVHHDASLDEITAELNAIVDEGAAVRDVIVEHPIYGELRGLLMIKSRHDVRQFCRRLSDSGAAPLLTLTGGVHLHTLEAADPDVFRRVRRSLSALGMLLDGTEK